VESLRDDLWPHAAYWPGIGYWRSRHAFFLAVAHWGKAGEPRREHCLAAIRAHQAHADAPCDSSWPNPVLLQALSLMYWGAGDTGRANETIVQAIAVLDAWMESEVWKAWRGCPQLAQEFGDPSACGPGRWSPLLPSLDFDDPLVSGGRWGPGLPDGGDDWDFWECFSSWTLEQTTPWKFFQDCLKLQSHVNLGLPVRPAFLGPSD
jgi:hypothetical protein